LVFPVACTGYVFTYTSFISKYFIHLLVLLSRIKVQQPISENGNDRNGFQRRKLNGTEILITNARGKTVQNMEKCAYTSNTADCEWLCV
jgi:hypothetical protein